MQEYRLTVIDRFGEKREHLCNKWTWDEVLMIYKHVPRFSDTVLPGEKAPVYKMGLRALYREFNSLEIVEVDDEG